MNSDFCCPKCKTQVISSSDGLSCQNCGRFYLFKDGYTDFIGESEFYAGEVSKKQMEELIKEIDSLGYDEGITRFFVQNPSLRPYVTDVRRIDWTCHCITRNNLRCLDIGSGLGNISENLSHIYQEVYSLEAVKERIEFQKRRYKNSNRTNIVIVRGNALELPFPDNYFDLVVCNGVLEWIGMMNSNAPPREAQLSFLREVKRVLANNGCLYVGIENRFGLPSFLGAKDHSGLPYTSLLPRRLANFVVKNFGYAGGVYGDKSERVKEQKGYYTYTYSIWGYRKLFEEADFRLKSYWVFPSYNEPYFSGSLKDKIGLRSFIRYHGRVFKRFKVFISIIGKMPKSLIGLMGSLFSPSFLFYCYKNDFTDSVDDVIVNNTGLENFTTLSKGSDIMYILYDKQENPMKVVHLKRSGYDLPSLLPFFDKTCYNPQIRKERIWSEDWINGKMLDPFKSNEIRLAIDWLIHFQQKTSRAVMVKDDIQLEVNSVRNNLLQIPSLNKSEYLKCVDDYQEYMEALRIDKTAEHGDFWWGNILIDHSANKVNVIDWENYREESSPFFDFVFFITSVILSGDGIKEFRNNLNENGNLSSIVREMRAQVDDHFGFKLNLDILIRFVILRFIIKKQLEMGTHDQAVIDYKKVIDTLL